MLEARAARRAAISVALNTRGWKPDGNRCVQEGGNQISIDELTATDTSMYGSVWPGMFGGSVQRRKTSGQG